MFEWIFLGLVFAGVGYLIYKSWKRKKLGIVPLNVSDFKATVLATGEALFSFRVSRKELEKLVKTMALHPGSTGSLSFSLPKRKRGRPPKHAKQTVAPQLSSMPKPECYGELAVGLPEKPECATCIWKEKCRGKS